MVGAHAYVAWRDASTGVWRLEGYNMRTRSASGFSRTTAGNIAQPASAVAASGSGGGGAKAPLSASLSSPPGGRRSALATAPPAAEDVRLVSIGPSTAEGRGNGGVSVAFWRPLASTGGAPAIHLSRPVPLVWALGDNWSDPPRQPAFHPFFSPGPTEVDLRTGAAGRGRSPGPERTLVAHGILMAIAYAGGMPLAAACARRGAAPADCFTACITAPVCGITLLLVAAGRIGRIVLLLHPPHALVSHAADLSWSRAALLENAHAALLCCRWLRAGGVTKAPAAWFHLHRATAWLTVATALAGTACALAYQHKRRGTVLPVSSHAKLGVAAVVLLCAQPVNALLRPHPDPLRRWLTPRFAWLVFHRTTAAAAVGVGIAALFTGAVRGWIAWMQQRTRPRRRVLHLSIKRRAKMVAGGSLRFINRSTFCQEGRAGREACRLDTTAVTCLRRSSSPVAPCCSPRLPAGLKLSCLLGIERCEDLRRALIVWLAALGAFVVVREACTALAPAISTCCCRFGGGTRGKAVAAAMEAAPPNASTAGDAPGTGGGGGGAPSPPRYLEGFLATAGGPPTASVGVVTLPVGAAATTKAGSGASEASPGGGGGPLLIRVLAGPGLPVAGDSTGRRHSLGGKSVALEGPPASAGNGNGNGNGGGGVAVPGAATSAAGGTGLAEGQGTTRLSPAARCERNFAVALLVWLVIVTPIAVAVAAGRIGGTPL